MFDKT